MNRIGTTLLVLVLCAVLAGPALASNPVRISQIHSGGGSSTGTYIKDWIELFNFSGSPVNIGGWVLEYGSATGNWGSSSTNYVVLPAGASIPACGYYLIECGTAGSGGVALPVPADLSTTNMSMGAASGKLGIFTALNANVVCGSEAPPGVIVDKIAWGSANCPEVADAPGMSTTTVDVRQQGGLQDTDNNANDFISAGAGVFAIHNSQSPPNPDCIIVPALPQTWGGVKAIYR